MHEEQITVLSMRKDGKAIKAALQGEGEPQWLTLPDNLIGKFEWKGSYHIGWTKTKRQDGGFFYNLKKLGGEPSNGATVTPIRPHVPTPAAREQQFRSPKEISVDIFIQAFGPIWAAQSDTPIDKFSVANFVRQMIGAYDLSFGGQTIPADSTDLVDDISDTF